MSSQTQAEEESIYTDAFVGRNSWNGREPNMLLLNAGEGRFVEVGVAFGLAGTKDGRGMAVADFDLDGDVDYAVNNYEAFAELWDNQVGNQRPWLAIRLRGQAPNTEAVGALIRVHTGERIQTRLVGVGSGYASQCSLEQLVGLGEAERVEKVVVTWPARYGQPAQVEAFGPFPARTRVSLVQGAGRPASAAPRPGAAHPEPSEAPSFPWQTGLLLLLGAAWLGLSHLGAFLSRPAAG